VRFLRLIMIGVSWLFFAAAIGWLFLGANLLAVPGCAPPGPFGCGAVETAVPPILVSIVNGIAKMIVTLLFLAIWAAILRPGSSNKPNDRN
jgi:hypothetical protein